MSSLEVVELVDIVGEDDVGLGMTLHVFDLLDFALERSEEALGNRVVPAVTLAAHAALDPVSFEGVSVIAACVGAAAVGVVDQALAGAAISQCRAKSSQGEVALDVGARGPTDHAPREQVENSSEVQPSL